jgi:hypothetical protein
MSISGAKYYLVCLDDFAHYLWTFPLTLKSETFSTLRNFHSYVLAHFNCRIQFIQCDNGREFDNNAARSFFLAHGIHLRLSCPHTSQQNGKAERVIRSINNIMRTLLFKHPCLLHIGLKPFALPLIYSIYTPPKLFKTELHTKPSLVHHLLMITFVCLDVVVTQTFLPPCPINLHHDLQSVSFLVSLTITNAIVALISLQTMSSSLVMFSLMKTISLLPATHHHRSVSMIFYMIQMNRRRFKQYSASYGDAWTFNSVGLTLLGL